MDYIAYFIIGVLLINGLPHFIQGICGNAFQSPFANPSGVGESSPIINALWGAFNFVVAYALFNYVGFTELGNNLHTLSLAAGAFICTVILTMHFGKVRNANIPLP